ncbi:MAG TPA: diaminopimelate decarboxylase [Limnochorda sp.]
MRLRGTMRVNEAGHLEIGGCDTVELAERFGTPLYVLDEAAFTGRVQELAAAFDAAYPGEVALVYAGKAFLTTGFARLLAAEGLWLDVASGGELYTAQAGGFPPGRIVVHGNNKSEQELRMSLEAGVARLVVDNLQELERLIAMTAGRPVATRLYLRLRPGIPVHTHNHMRTGQEDSKFGLGPEEAFQAVERLRTVDHLELAGLHAHLGSQLRDPEPYRRLAQRMVAWLEELGKAYGRPLEELDLGGGWGVAYRETDPEPPVELWAQAVGQAVAEAARARGLALPRLLVEPGRSAIAAAGTTLYRVGAVKVIPGVRRYVVTDGGIYENARVAMYGTAYEAAAASKMNDPALNAVPTRVVGKNCESGDVLADDVALPALEPGDLLAVPVTGAYHYAMASNYNRLPRPAVVVVYQGEAELLVERESYEDLIRHDRIPARWSQAAPALRESVSRTP